jgi:hypothetical protein
MPTVAELRRLVLEAVHGAIPTALEAWDGVVDAIRRHGYTTAPDLPPLTMRAIAAVGGWRHVCAPELPEAVRARSCGPTTNWCGVPNARR